MLYGLLVTFMIFMFNSCAPLSKEGYMERCEKFYSEVSQSHMTYSEHDWQKVVEKADVYYDEYYDKFEEELSFKEKMYLQSQLGKMFYYMGLYEIKCGYSDLKQEWNEEIQRLEEESAAVEDYFRNDLVDDLEEMGRATDEFLNELWSDIENILEE